MVRGVRILLASVGLVLLMSTGVLAAGTVRLYTQFVDEWWHALYKQFEQETGMKLEVTELPWGELDKFVASVAGGVSPDVALMDSSVLVTVADKGMAMDLTPFFRRDGFRIDELPPALVKAVGGDRGVAVPDNFDPYGVWYDREAYRQAGLAEPSATWTYDDYGAYAAKLTSGGEGAKRVYGSNPLHWQPVAWAAGGELIDAQGRFAMNKPAVVDALQWAYDLMWQRHVVPTWGTFTGSSHTWLPAGNVRMHWAGPWYLTAYLKDKIDWGLAVPPRGVAGQAARLFVGGYMIPTTATNAQGGWTFIKWIQSDKVWRQRALKFTHIPLKAAVRQQQDLLYWQVFGQKWAPVLTQTLAVGRAIPFHPIAFEIDKRMNKALGDGPEANTKSVRVAIEEVQPQIEALLKEHAARQK